MPDAQIDDFVRPGGVRACRAACRGCRLGIDGEAGFIGLLAVLCRTSSF